MNIADLLDLAVALEPDRRIVTDASRTFTLAELRGRAVALGQQLAGRPAGPVAFVATNSVAAPIVMFASAYAGRAFAPLNYRGDVNLTRHYLETLRPGVAVADAAHHAKLHAAGPDTTVVDVESVLALDAVDAAGSVPPHADVAAYIFTSGTSRAPKAVTLRHGHLFQYIVNSASPMSEPAGAATLTSAPNYHIATVAAMLSATYSGRRLVFLERFSGRAWLEAARRESVTSAFVVPTMLYRIVEALEGGEPAPERLELVSYGGAPMPRSTLLRAIAAFPPSVGFANAYGLTETSSTIAILGPEDHRAALASSDPVVQARIGSVGRPLPSVELRLAATGEILVRGPQVSAAYVSEAGRLDADGWFHTGDLGRLDRDGYLYVLGRADDMIIRGGENISPVEVEEAMRAFAGVVDAAVVGVADEEWGQRVEAVVEADAPLDLASLDRFLRQRLPGFKCPARVVVAPDLPRNDMGKVVRRRVADLLAEAGRAPA